MPFVFKHTWILFMAVVVANGLIFKVRSRAYIESDPDLKPGYDKLIRGWLIYVNLPWAVMAIGDLTGMTNGTFDYFRPRLLNPVVLIFHLTVVVIWALGCKWIYVDGGANSLARHPGFVIGGRGEVTSPLKIKVLWGIGVLAGIVAMSSMWLYDVPPLVFK